MKILAIMFGIEIQNFNIKTKQITYEYYFKNKIYKV